MVGWLKALLFVAGGVAAAAGTAYLTGLLDPMLGRQPQVVASLPQGGQQPVQQQAPEAVEEGSVPLPEDGPQVTEKRDRVVAPTFDLLRVEPDGSMLIAGKAAGGATVEVLDGDDVLVSTKAEPSGDFVAVLDQPLSPGDYRLSLRAATEGGDQTVSPQTAIVSVPETQDGQVLAMVEAPGQAAQLITVPQTPAVNETGDEETEVAAAQPAEAPATEEPQAVAEEPAADAADQQPAAQETAEVTAGEAAGSEAAAVEEEQTGQPAAAKEQEARPENPAVAEQQDEAPAAQERQVEAAAVAEEEQPTEAAGEQTPAADLTVVVEAVEIEGDTIFVAGQAAPGRTVRVYANEMLIGDALASEGGRFLVEERRELPVGSYTIRADLLDENGAVLARAAVPFEREAGESIAAVAPQPQSPRQPAEGEAGQTEQAATGPAAEEQSADTEVATAAQGAAETTAPALERVDGAVIIRRGDSLWRISRRVYGRGVRYSTIYLANQDQITDPNRIWPGQVFAVPRETSEGEQADMEAIGDQAVTRDGENAAQ